LNLFGITPKNINHGTTQGGLTRWAARDRDLMFRTRVRLRESAEQEVRQDTDLYNLCVEMVRAQNLTYLPGFWGL
jgi:hypothetical protein